ncbi:putative retrieval of early ER protein Rer1 [Helianthus anomalus]
MRCRTRLGFIFLCAWDLYSYALGIYILNLLIRFLSPQVDPEFQDLSDGPFLPNRSSDEFRPFVRRLPEFKFWGYLKVLLEKMTS